MSKCYPDAIPSEYQANEILADAYKRGWNHGHGLACHNVPTLGDKLWVDDMGKITVDADNIREVHASQCYSAKTNSRCYSPFEFTAKEFNDYDEEYSIETAEEDGETIFFVADRDLEDVADQDFHTREAAQAWIDARPSSEEVWAAFEDGTNHAIAADLAEYTDEDYGIEAESEAA